MPKEKFLDEEGVKTLYNEIHKEIIAISPSALAALEALAETNIAKPAYNNNMLYTNNNGSIYVL